MPLSTTVSQSSSLPLHTSGWGGVWPTHTGAPFTHWRTPALHGSTLLPHTSPNGFVRSSSICLSQSSSTPLQTSVCGPTSPAQDQPVLPRQISVPGLHAPPRDPRPVQAPPGGG